MTEEEARTKLCPKRQSSKMINAHSIVMIHISTPENEKIIENLKSLLSGNDESCIASDCMMWQWSFFGVDMSQAKECQANSGYCGLAK